MTDKQPRSIPEALPRPLVRHRRVDTWLIWLVPMMAAVVGVILLVHARLQSGPVITISFQSAEGLVEGKTPVKYKSVTIGKVDKIRLGTDREHVIVAVTLDKSASSFATTDTRFWIVRPRIGPSGISGITTLLSGAYIAADVGKSSKTRKRFKGLALPPAVTHGSRGRSFVLHAKDLGSLDVGAPVYYRHIKVGQVTSYQIDNDGSGVTLRIFVTSPNDRFVTDRTRFWNASGLDVSVGANGVKLKAQSLVTIVAGGVAFQGSPGGHKSAPARENAKFYLFADKSTAMRPLSGVPYYICLRFKQALRGLSVGAPVDFLGVEIGKVISIRLDYDGKTQNFPLLVNAVVYPRRLGQSNDKLVNLARVHGEKADFPHIMTRLVGRGLRAQARTGNLLTGKLYIALDFLSDVGKKYADPNVQPLEIPTVSGSFNKVQQQLAEIVSSVRKIPFARIGRHLDRVLVDVDVTLKHVDGSLLPQMQQTLKGAQSTLDSASQILASDSPLQQNLVATLSELRRAARSLSMLGNYLSVYPEALIRGRRSDPVLPVVPKAKPSRGSAR